MTICVGLLSQDGVILAADTQETTGASKTTVPKILTGMSSGVSGHGCIAVTGAGEAGYLDSIKPQIVGLFLDRCKSDSISKFENDLGEIVRKFHVKHVIPFAKYPDYDRPAIDLLIGVSHPKLTRLWQTDKTAMQYCAPSGYVGIGRAHAKALFSRLHVSYLETDLMKIIAAYVIWSTKRTVDGCGGSTHLVTVAGDVAAYLPDDIIQEMENLFTSYDGIEARAFYHAVGNPSVDSNGDMQKVSRWLESLREKFIDLRSRM